MESIPGGAQVGKILERVHRDHDPSKPAASLAGLLEGRAALARLQATADQTYRPLLLHKARELDEAIRSCAGLWLEAVATQHALSTGDSIRVDVTAIIRSDAAFRLTGLRSATPGVGSTVDTVLAENRPMTTPLRSTVPPDLDSTLKSSMI